MRHNVEYDLMCFLFAKFSVVQNLLCVSHIVMTLSTSGERCISDRYGTQQSSSVDQERSIYSCACCY